VSNLGRLVLQKNAEREDHLFGKLPNQNLRCTCHCNNRQPLAGENGDLGWERWHSKWGRVGVDGARALCDFELTYWNV